MFASLAPSARAAVGAVAIAGASSAFALCDGDADSARNLLRRVTAARRLTDDVSEALPAPLHPKKLQAFTVVRNQQISPDTHKLRLRFPEGTSDKNPITVASLIVASAEINGEKVERPYTPVSPLTTRGYLDLMVKSYGPDSKMSNHICTRKAGETVAFRGPYQKFEYKANQVKYLGLIAGGSGITPMIQLLHKILKDPRDKTEVRLLYANKSPADILMKEELDVLAFLYPNFKVVYTVDGGADDDWSGYVGHVSEGMLTDTMPPPSPDTLICVCGPPGMMKHVSGDKAKDYSQGEVDGLLKKGGYTKEMVFKY